LKSARATNIAVERPSSVPGKLSVLQRVRDPVTSQIAIPRNRHITQEVCLRNVKFARALPEGSPYAARAVLAGKDARVLAAEILAMDDVAYRDAFKGSAMKRAKLAGLERKARVVLDAQASESRGRSREPFNTPGPSKPRRHPQSQTGEARESQPPHVEPRDTLTQRSDIERRVRNGRRY
jgi:hypothetical protein